MEDEAFVGMGATLLDGVVVERGAFVAAGAMVTENTRIPAGQVPLSSHTLVHVKNHAFYYEVPTELSHFCRKQNSCQCGGC